MANSNFYALVQPGGRNGGNAQLTNMIDSDTLPWALSPELVFAQRITWKDLRDSVAVEQTDTLLVGGTLVFGTYTVTLTNAQTGAAGSVSTVVHEDTVTIGGTASDGNYDTVFVTPTVPVRARVTRATTPATNDNIATAMAAAITDLVATDLAGIVTSASANASVVTIVYAAGIAPQNLTCTETTATGTITASVAATASSVATALEAALATARATTLAALLEDESVSTATITLDYVDGIQVVLSASFPGTATATITPSIVATIPIGTVGNLFPANVWVEGDRGAGQNVITEFAGITTIAATLGDADAVDGLMTSTTLATAGFTSTIGAAEYAPHMETAFEPVFVITANEPFNNLTAGEVEVFIPYSPPPTI